MHLCYKWDRPIIFFSFFCLLWFLYSLQNKLGIIIWGTFPHILFPRAICIVMNYLFLKGFSKLTRNYLYCVCILTTNSICLVAYDRSHGIIWFYHASRGKVATSLQMNGWTLEDSGSQLGVKPCNFEMLYHEIWYMHWYNKHCLVLFLPFLEYTGPETIE